ncbi:DNA polymerase beta domain-containing protein [Methyloglobulus morosus KoM1]|uniref:DNA polymerase beta domain-containing protein n=1 Tax=Methyloglobulus morosus KoM1 TaxID=1116472 RepID=V5B243_9GAMM|nr:nucleotidyltransferase domain-containing protein [Methyloglobulus morosus]ESS67235.1 DNA polymerase beta domain-containing protein [Methyloglobulus morosus KoM1]
MNATTADKLGLSQTTLDKLNSIFRQHNSIGLVLIYGSRAKGNYRPGSDIDLTIKGGDLDFAELTQILDQIDDLSLPYTVDLSHYSQLSNPDLIAHIDRVGVVIYDRDAESDKAIAENLARIKQ